MRFLPVFLDLSAGHVVLVGSGPQAIAKLQLLRASGTHIRWFRLGDNVYENTASNKDERIEIVFGEPREDDLHGALAVVASAGRDADERIATRARAMNVPVNIVDRPDLSTFIFPAIVDRGDVVVAIGTGGASPVLARRIRERIEAILPAGIGALAALTYRYRERVAALRTRGISARAFW